MKVFVAAIALTGGLAFSSHAASANSGAASSGQADESNSPNMAIVGVALADGIQNREPDGPVSPAISCETHNSSQSQATPVVDSQTHGQLFFWNTVQSSADSKLRHIWLMKRNQDWKSMAEVDLTIAKSPNYRTWSSKKLDPKWHRGDWKIEVVEADQPENVLCQSSFRIE